MKELVVAYRRVPAEQQQEYHRLWLELQDQAQRAGLHAWRYRSTDVPDEFVEFVEASSANEDPAGWELEAIRQTLDELSPASGSRWEEAPAPGAEAAQDDRSTLLSLLQARSLKRGEFVLASGQRSDYYIDARPTTMSAMGQRLIGRLGLREIDRQGWKGTAVGGLTLGADPVAYAIAHTSALRGRPINAFTVRKKAKEHGTSRRIEGNLAEGSDVVVVEDVMTSGASSLEAVEAVAGAGANVLGVLTVVDRESGGAEKLAGAGYPLTSLFTARQLLER